MVAPGAPQQSWVPLSLRARARGCIFPQHISKEGGGGGGGRGARGAVPRRWSLSLELQLGEQPETVASGAPIPHGLVCGSRMHTLRLRWNRMEGAGEQPPGRRSHPRCFKTVLLADKEYILIVVQNPNAEERI
eukprot:COSAG02_NODE_741_length_17813_cov_51.487863_20_plen_133_part_00